MTFTLLRKPIRHPDDPPPPRGSRYVLPVILPLMLLLLLSPFAVSYYRNTQMAAHERSTIALMRRYAEAQQALFSRENHYAKNFAELGGEWTNWHGMDEQSPTEIDGYRFRILTSQGNSAEGGPKSYIDEHGKMTRGFGLLAAPARYGFTGKGTFLMSGNNGLYREDFGVKSAQIIDGLHEFIIPPHQIKIPLNVP